jgi:hypothetical protein
VQLVKDTLHLLNETGWPVRRVWRPGDFVSGAVLRTGDRSGLRSAFTSRYRRWPGFGNGHRPRLWPPGRSPERNRGHRCGQDNGQ